MAKRAKEQQEQVLTIQRLERRYIKLLVLGKSPLVMNRLPKKAKEELLFPKVKTNRAAREAALKHDPIAEFRDSVYRCRDPQAPTYVHMPDGAFKKALASAALDIPGATKAEIGRLVKVTNETVHIYGRPYLYMAPVRQAGMAKTPDIRTRAIFPQWGCELQIQFIAGKILEQGILNLADAAGEIIGVGDGRTEKGTFNMGEFELVLPEDPRWQAILKQGRKVQQAAMEASVPECIDEDSEELLAWFRAELVRRERDRGSKETTITAGKRGKAPVKVVVASEQKRARNGRSKTS